MLWDGAERVEFRTHVSGSIGQDHLLRVRFPARRARRAAGVPDGDGGDRAAVRRARGGRRRALVDARQPGQPLVRARRSSPGSRCRADRATGAAGARGGRGGHARRDCRPGRGAVVQGPRRLLAAAGVTATTSRAVRSRYGVDRRGLQPARLPDRARRPEENAFTAEVLAACRPGGAPSGCRAGWPTAPRPGCGCPPRKSRAAAFAPGADLRGPRDLPVLIVAAPRTRRAGHGGRRAGGRAGRRRSVRADVARRPGGGRARRRRAARRTAAVALFNRGTPGRARSRPDGTLWMSLLPCLLAAGRAGSGSTATGRTAPDGVVVRLAALVAHVQLRAGVAGPADDWREARVQRGRRGLQPRPDRRVVTGPTAAAGRPAGRQALLSVEGRAERHACPRSSLFGNPLAAGRPGRRPPTAKAAACGDGAAAGDRRAACAGRGCGWRRGVEAAWRTDLLEELTEADGSELGRPRRRRLRPGWRRSRPSRAARPAEGGRRARPPPRRGYRAGAAGAGCSRSTPGYWLHGKGPGPGR